MNNNAFRTCQNNHESVPDQLPYCEKHQAVMKRVGFEVCCPICEDLFDIPDDFVGLTGF